MTRWRRALRALPPDCMLAVPGVLGSLVWFTVVHFGSPGTNGVGNIPERLVSLVGAHAAFLVIPVAVWMLVRRDPLPERATALLIVAVLLGCVVRGFAFGWLLYLTGAAPEVEVLFRTNASLAHMTLAVGFLWLVTAAVRRYAERRRELLAEQEQLLILQSQAAVQLRQLDDQTAEQVRASVLGGLGSGELKRGQELLHRLRLTLDDVVRPLSRQLEAQGEVWVEPARPSADCRVRWWPTVKGAADPVRLHPIAIFLMIQMAVLSATPRYGAAVIGVTALSALIVLLPLLWLLRSVGVRITRRAPRPLKATAFMVALVVPGLAFGRFDLLYEEWTTVHTPFPLAAPVYTVLFGVILALADSALSQAQEVEDELSATTAQMRWALARAREEHRQHRLALAHAVHGTIQATLAAAVLQLDRAVREGTADEAMVAEVQQRVVACVEGLDLRFAPPDDLPELLDKLQTTWLGVTSVTLDVQESVEAVLAGDALVLRTINDLLPELVFNAIKHGRARQVRATLRLESPEALELVVRDDGTPEGTGAHGGMGTRLLEDCSIEWSRERRDDECVVRAVLPVLPAPSTAMGPAVSIRVSEGFAVTEPHFA